jgi:hypothetical protein
MKEKENKVQLPMKAQPFIKRMIEAEAEFHTISTADVIEQWALMYCTSPKSQQNWCAREDLNLVEFALFCWVCLGF